MEQKIKKRRDFSFLIKKMKTMMIKIMREKRKKDFSFFNYINGNKTL